MILNLFKISLIYAGIFVLFHAVVPHDHHEIEDEHICLHSHEDPSSIYEYLEQALHFSEHNCNDSYVIFNDLDLFNQKPLVLKWVKKSFIFTEFKLSFVDKIENCFSILQIISSRGPPLL